jgi:AbrB family looped-hinge helix DNA binding protein
MAVVAAIYGFLDMALLLASALVERVRTLLRVLGVEDSSGLVKSTAETTDWLWVLGESMERLTKINARGQVTIPAEIRTRFGMKPGTHISWTEDHGRLVLTTMTKKSLREICGFLKSVSGEPSAFDELFAERERERRREDLKLAKATKIMARYRNTLRSLSK